MDEVFSNVVLKAFEIMCLGWSEDVSSADEACGEDKVDDDTMLALNDEVMSLQSEKCGGCWRSLLKKCASHGVMRNVVNGVTSASQSVPLQERSIVA